MVLVSRENETFSVLKTISISHEGNPASAILSAIEKFESLEDVRIATSGRKFRHLLDLPSISEPQALESALSFTDLVKNGYRTIVSAGGETFMAYLLDADGKVETVHTGNKCASGTGEFLVQQLGRMGLDLNAMAELDENMPAHKVSGRCSVFCKSDCTHALNKGIEKDSVVAGLARMMAGKCIELLRKLPSDKVALIGSCSLNKFMVRELRKKLPDLAVPEQAYVMEALGAAIWGADNGKTHTGNFSSVIRKGTTSFTFLPPLEAHIDSVDFHEDDQADFFPESKLALGLDVGSTTTKGVLVDLTSLKTVASCYLRTDGDPIGASRKVYSELASQVPAGTTASIMGVTGSGRNIAGLHAGTAGIINEITAHAAAAVHYDPEVDTIFEIGGQDAKYTWLKNSVPCDYAMNEACSAGTGSFLEESAKETLGIEVTDIAAIAFKGQNPPNFNDQCAAFIGSDLKLASQEGVPLDDIIAGLVYSVCINYSNRVKGNRTLGNKIFMQGGVCYNKAVPVAMAALTGRKIIVPPHPGLTGAFGVALEAIRRTKLNLLNEGTFDLTELSLREVHYKTPFICKGAGRDCDLGCSIARITVNDKTFPFGGICNRFDNSKVSVKLVEGEDLVTWREKRVFRDLSEPQEGKPTIGMNRSLLMNTWFPLYNTFFRALGFEIRLPDKVDLESIEQKGAPFCHPVELAHGSMGELLKLKTDHIFLPHVRSLPLKSGDRSSTCVLVQGETYYLRSAFPELENRSVLTPVIHMQEGMDQVRKTLVKMAKSLSVKAGKASDAFDKALAEQDRFFADIRIKGEQYMADLENQPEQNGVVLFGRPYNAFNSWANKSIPAKFSTRATNIIPCDMLPSTNGCNADRNMYWATGEQIMESADYVAKHPQLFGTFITNFSCGPDSFLLGHFRRAMGKKPSLTLELDSHTADAGIETRIEAFLDIVNGFKLLKISSNHDEKTFTPALSEPRNGISGIIDSSGRWRAINDPDVILLIPSLGEISTDFLAASMSRDNIRYKVLPHANEAALKLGRNNSSCKECLPLQLTSGALLAHLEERKKPEVSLFLMPTAKGPCRFGQYSVFMNDLVERLEIPDLAMFSPSSTNGYGGFSTKVVLGLWQGIVTGSILEDIHASIVTGAKDKENALKLFWKVRQDLLKSMTTNWKDLSRALHKGAKELSVIKLEKNIEEYPVISILGEIYVRHDPLARRSLPERLSKEGFIIRVAPVLEWMKYTDWLNRKGIEGKAGLGSIVKQGIKGYFEKRIRAILSKSGLVHFEGPNIGEIVATAAPHISDQLTGEAVLTVGASLHEIMNPSCGVISIGPFGCMPSRVAESILSEKFRAVSAGNKASSFLEKDTRLPFLAIETDGNPFPQLIEARLEAFCLQASRLHLRKINQQN